MTHEVPPVTLLVVCRAGRFTPEVTATQWNAAAYTWQNGPKVRLIQTRPMVTEGGNISYGKRTSIGGDDEGYAAYNYKGGEEARKGGSRVKRQEIYRHNERVRRAVNEVHVPIYRLFPWAWEDLLARTERWELKELHVKEGTKETLDPLDGTPIAHLNTTCKTKRKGLPFTAMGHADADAPLEDLGAIPPAEDGLTMYALGIWYPIGYVGKSCFFFADYNLKIRLDRPIAMIWSASFVHGSYGDNCPQWCDIMGTSLEVSRRTTNYKKAKVA